MSNIIEIGGGASGGSNVVANPVEAATDTLSKIGINGTVYDISGGGGGSGHNYSTTEQIVGTWIDGSILYEKTIPYNSSVIPDAYIVIENDNTVELKGIDLGGSYCVRQNGQIWTLGSTYTEKGFLIYQETTKEVYFNNNTTETFSQVVITIRYTKASV